MRKMILEATLCMGCLFILYGSAFAQELVVPPEMRQALERELSKPLRMYPLDPEEAGRIDEAFSAWVSRSIDLATAQKRESERFKDRVTYYQEVPENVPRFIREEFGQIGLRNPRPVEIFHRRGPNWFSFRKILDIEAEGKIEREEAIQMVRDFLLRNNFVKITDSDTFGEILVPELRSDYHPDPDSPVKDVLILQSVKFRREFMGSPVANSRISVDLHPDTQEILGFKHYNWIPAKERNGVTIPQESVKSPSEVEDNLREKIRAYCRESEQANLVSITPAWFQTNAELIPILVCEIEVARIEREDRFTEYINTAGSDDVFYLSRR